MGNRRVSDRERARLRGPVRTCVDYCGDETESMSEAEYGPDGRLLMWRGRISGGARIERVYSYNKEGKLVGVAGGEAQGIDEFCFDERERQSKHTVDSMS